MNKIVYIVLILIGLGLIIYNITEVNFQAPLEGNSIIAVIGIVAALCAVVLLLIYLTSKKIEEQVNE